MISYLSGKVVEKHPTSIIIDVGGIGYEVLIPLSSYDRLPSIGGECTVLTHHHIREDSEVLFGFMTGKSKIFHLFAILAITTVTWLSFSNGIPHAFTFDDWFGIVNNKDLQPSQGYLQLWGNDMWGKDIKHIESHRSYRPLLITLFKIYTTRQVF